MTSNATDVDPWRPSDGWVEGPFGVTAVLPKRALVPGFAQHLATPELRGGCAVETDNDTELLSLLNAVMQHDQHAFHVLYERTAPRVHALALHLTQIPELAEETVETVFWQVWRDAPRFDASRGRVMAWIMVIARTRAFDAMRRERRHGNQRADDLENMTPIDEAAHPDQLLSLVQRDMRLHGALAVLPVLQRKLIDMAFFNDCTHEEIATQLQMPLGTVKSHIRRTLMQLQTLLVTAP